MEAELKGKLLCQEYAELFSFVRHYDTKSYHAKTWSITFGLGGIGLAFAQKIPALLLIVGVGSIALWLFDYYLGKRRDRHFERIHQLEAYFRGDIAEIAAGQIDTAWCYASTKSAGPWRLTVLLPHAGVALICFALLFLYP